MATLAPSLTVAIENQIVCLDSLSSIYEDGEISSGYTAYSSGNEVGKIWKQSDAPDIDLRFLGATTMLAGSILNYSTFLALIGSDIDVPEEETRRNAAECEEGEIWDVTHARFADHGGAVEGCDAGAQNSRYYEVNIFSTFNIAVGSLAFETWNKLETAGPGFRTQNKALKRLIYESTPKKSICFTLMGERRASSDSEAAPYATEILKYQSTTEGCTWRSLASAMFQHDCDQESLRRFRGSAKRMRKTLGTLSEPSNMEEFAKNVRDLPKSSALLMKVTSEIHRDCGNANLMRARESRERFMLSWILDPARTGIYSIQVVDSGGYAGHAVAIDATRRLVYDSYLKRPLYMDSSLGNISGIANVLYYCCEGSRTCQGIRSIYKLRL